MIDSTNPSPLPAPQARPVTRGVKERGMAVLITGLMLSLTLGTVGLAVDGGVAYVIKGRLMAAVDSAALAAGRSLNLGADLSAAQAQATSSATRFFNANFPEGYLGVNSAATTIVPAFTMLTGAGGLPSGILQVDVTGAVTAPTYFMKIFNIPNVRISATGTATRRTLVMVLIVDLSGSMGTRNSPVGTVPTTVTNASSSCEAMVFSSINFINNFSPYDYIGLVSFSDQAQTRYTPSTNFKASGAAGMTNTIANLQCGGNTNTTPSLQLAWQHIQNINLPLALNSIVLFTDGVPNRVNANFPLRTQKDTRAGPAPVYSLTNPPSDNRLLYSDPLDPLTYNPGLAAPPTLPIPASTNLNTVNNNSYGWYLSSNSGPFRPRWVRDVNAPAGNAATCRAASITVNCYMLPLPSTNTTPALLYGTIWQASDYSASLSNREGVSTPLVGGPARTNPPSGFPNSNDAFTSQTIAYIPNTDVFGNSHRGFRDNRVYQVNQQCAPPGTVMAGGASRCRNLGGQWSAYPAVGVGSNFWASGPYQGFLRTDVANTYVVAAMNSAVSAAANIRANTTFNVRIDTVFLTGGDTIIDREFLQIIANEDQIIPLVFEPTGTSSYVNPYYQTSQQQGMFLYTTSGTGLNALFALIASSLLRISK